MSIYRCWNFWPTAYIERQLRWEIVDRERWLNSFIPAPITDLKLVKWRHWKPSRIKELGPINQKVLEGHLRRKWAERLLAHLIPHAGEIAHLAPLRRDNEEQEFHDLLGDTRFRTLRQRCLVLEQMLKWELPIPWKESNVRELLNRLRAQEVTPALLGHTTLVRQEIRAFGCAGRTPPSSEEADRGDRTHSCSGTASQESQSTT